MRRMDFVRNRRVFDVCCGEYLFGRHPHRPESTAVTGTSSAVECEHQPDEEVPEHFRAVHGSARNRPARVVANPLAAILSSARMLDPTLGLSESRAGHPPRRGQRFLRKAACAQPGPRRSATTTHMGDPLWEPRIINRTTPET